MITKDQAAKLKKGDIIKWKRPNEKRPHFYKIITIENKNLDVYSRLFGEKDCWECRITTEYGETYVNSLNDRFWYTPIVRKDLIKLCTIEILTDPHEQK